MTSRMFIPDLGAIVLLLLSALPANARPQSGQQSPSIPQPRMGTRQKAPEIPNFGKVSPKLYRGGQPGTKGMEALKNMGIDIVVDMRGGRNKNERATVARLGMQYVSIPWHCPFPTDKPFARFLKLLQENPQKKIFVHCRLGDDRTGMAIAAYRMADEGWSADEAMNEMRMFGFNAAHHGICPGLAHYEHTFPKRLKTSRAFKDLPQDRPASKSIAR